MKTGRLKYSMATWMVVASVMATSCGGDSFREPQDAVDGYSVQTRFQKWIITNLSFPNMS